MAWRTWGAHVGHGVADGLHHVLLLLGLDAKGGGDELLQVFAGRPGAFAHEFDGGRVVLKAWVHAGGEHVVGGREVHIGPAGVEQRQVFGVAIGVAQGVGQQQGGGQLAKGF
jgi:hypothetical protein